MNRLHNLDNLIDYILITGWRDWRENMTKAKALELLEVYRRNAIDPALARKIAKAFGYTLKDLGIKPIKVKDQYRMMHSDEVSELSSVGVYTLARSLCKEITGEELTSGMHGRGSYADDITKQAVEKIRAVK